MKTAVIATFTAVLLALSLHAQSAPPASHPKPVKHHAHKVGKHPKHHHKRHKGA